MRIDIHSKIGKRYGRLIILSEFGRTKDCKWLVKCACDCGKTTVTRLRSLQLGDTKSCGCLALELLKQRKRHGMCKTTIYFCWRNMLNRCENKSVESYKDYGGRGIEVCRRWHNFSKFYADMGEPPPGHQLDRIDNNGPYAPENCQWVTQRENAQNKRDTIYITVGDKTKTISQWSKISGLKHTLIYSRHRKNWPASRILERTQCHT